MNAVVKPIATTGGAGIRRAGTMFAGILMLLLIAPAPRGLARPFRGPRRPVFRRMDRNHDGRIGPRERRRAAEVRRQKARVNRPWEAKADRNHDGKVDAAELRAWHFSQLDRNHDGRIDPRERRHFWLLKKARVDTPWEKKHDTDGNGIITGEEARKMLHDRYILVKTHGKAKTDSEIEEEFDANNDGLIDGREAEAVLEALGERKGDAADKK